MQGRRRRGFHFSNQGCSGPELSHLRHHSPEMGKPPYRSRRILQLIVHTDPPSLDSETPSEDVSINALNLSASDPQPSTADFLPSALRSHHLPDALLKQVPWCPNPCPLFLTSPLLTLHIPTEYLGIFHVRVRSQKPLKTSNRRPQCPTYKEIDSKFGYLYPAQRLAGQLTRVFH